MTCPNSVFSAAAFKSFSCQCLRCGRRFPRRVDFDLHLAVEHYADSLAPPGCQWLLGDNEEGGKATTTCRYRCPFEGCAARFVVEYLALLFMQLKWVSLHHSFHSRSGLVGHMELSHRVMEAYFGTVHENDFLREITNEQ